MHSRGNSWRKQATRLVVFRGPKRTRKTMLPLLQPARRHFTGYFKKQRQKPCVETRLRMKIYHKNISFLNWNCCCSNLILESNRQHCQIPWNLFLGLYWVFFQFSCWRQVQYKSAVVSVEFMQLFYINYWQESGWKLKNVGFNKYYLIWQNN